MGLDATVYCACVEQGRLRTPHPYPDRLYIGPDGCPEINSSELSEEVEHDEWCMNLACEHEDCVLVSHHLGSSAHIANLRANVSQLLPVPEESAPLIWSRVIYSGTHCGDQLHLTQVHDLRGELARLRRTDRVCLGAEDVDRVEVFIQQMEELCSAALHVGKPIVF